MKKTSDFNFDLKQLRSFLTVLSENGFTRASRKLKLGQATISHHIQQIEDTLGVKLIQRSSKDLTITREGIIFKEFCDSLFLKVEMLQSDLSNSVMSGKTEIAASTIPSAYFIPHVISNLKKMYPDFFYSTRVSDSREAIELIKDGTVEIGVIGKSIKHPLLVLEKIYSDTIVLVGNISSPGYLTLEQIKTIPLIMRESGSGTRNAVENELIKNEIYPSDLNIVYECSTNESIKESVAIGLGFAFVSKLSIIREIELEVLKVIEIGSLSIKRDFFVCFLRNKDLTKAAKLLLEELHKINI